MAQSVARNPEPATAGCFKEGVGRHGVSAEPERQRTTGTGLQADAEAVDFKAFLMSCPDGVPDEVVQRSWRVPRSVDL